MHVTPPPNPRCNSCSTITRASEVPNRGRPRPAPVSGIVAITLVVMTLTSAGCAAADALSQVRLVVGEDLNIHTMNGTTETVAELPSRVFAGFSEVDNAGTYLSLSRDGEHIFALLTEVAPIAYSIWRIRWATGAVAKLWGGAVVRLSFWALRSAVPP